MQEATSYRSVGLLNPEGGGKRSGEITAPCSAPAAEKLPSGL